MKKIFMLLTLMIIIGCSLDTFKSENIASWSINLDVPLYKTEYTVREMLKKYDELSVEPYGTSGDSIFVFNASTPHIINIPDYTITKVGNDIQPEVVIVDKYEVEIPTLPDELAGVNFVDIDLTLEVDLSQFNVALADSVIVDEILIVGTNDDGDEERATIRNQDVLVNGTLVIENPEDLINIRPTVVTISGQITIYPSDQPGVEVSNQIIILTSVLHAPLVLEIVEASAFDAEPQKIASNVDDQVFKSFTLFAEIENQMEIGGKLQILVSPDTMNFKENSSIIPDTLLSFQFFPQQFQIEIIELDSVKFNLIADSTYIKTLVNLVGMPDGTPTRFMTNDSIKVLLYGSAEVLVETQDRAEEE